MAPEGPRNTLRSKAASCIGLQPRNIILVTTDPDSLCPVRFHRHGDQLRGEALTSYGFFHPRSSEEYRVGFCYIKKANVGDLFLSRVASQAKESEVRQDGQLGFSVLLKLIGTIVEGIGGYVTRLNFGTGSSALVRKPITFTQVPCGKGGCDIAGLGATGNETSSSPQGQPERPAIAFSGQKFDLPI